MGDNTKPDTAYYLREKEFPNRYVCKINKNASTNGVYNFVYSDDHTSIILFSEKEICYYYSNNRLVTHDLFEVVLGHQVNMVVNFVPLEQTEEQRTEKSEVIIKE